MERSVYAADERGIRDEELMKVLGEAISGVRGRVLLLPPDLTRLHSGGGKIANLCYHLLEGRCEVDVMPALGTHQPMTEAECRFMYGDIPFDRIFAHNWRRDVAEIGRIPRELVREVSEGFFDHEIGVEVNQRLLSGYDRILSIGQVIPHEVAGLANQLKNILVGCGGASLINASHIVSAFYGVERVMGRDHTPARRLFDHAERFLAGLPIQYALTVADAPAGEARLHGLFIGEGRACFEEASRLSLQVNVTWGDAPLKKVVAFLDGAEFKTTWLGNKAVYRTRMAIADGGELIVLAPGVKGFGEDPACDQLIRKYGYCGRERVIELCRTEEDLKANLSAAAHLIHGSPDGRFSVTYCTRFLDRAAVESVGYRYMPYGEAAAWYDPSALPDGEEIYFIPNPALGLWATRGALA
jgi:nickel-dependent lactate racemase